MTTMTTMTTTDQIRIHGMTKEDARIKMDFYNQFHLGIRTDAANVLMMDAMIKAQRAMISHLSNGTH